MKLFKNLTMKMEKKKKKIILFYERLVSKIVLIETTKLFFFWLGVCIYITYQRKKCLNMCVYIIKMCACVC